MWPARNPGENARLYKAVKALSDFCMDLGINVPTGKDSLSMTQKYPDGTVVYSPGTVIVSSVAEVTDVRQVVPQVLDPDPGSHLYYIDFSDGLFSLGGSSLAQALNQVGDRTPDAGAGSYFRQAFDCIQKMVSEGLILSGHDVSAGGLSTCLLEMCFPLQSVGIEMDASSFPHSDLIRILFSEQPAVVIQVKDDQRAENLLNSSGVRFCRIGNPIKKKELRILDFKGIRIVDIDQARDTWYRTSYLLDRKQSGEKMAESRFMNYKVQPLKFNFPHHFTGIFGDVGIDPGRRTPTGIRSAIIREKGVNGDREMAYAMYLAGMDVRDVHMTDLISGRETLEDINLIVFVGGFSNSDVLGSAKGWAGAFLYNPAARKALERYYSRKDTLSLGVCNGCQVMMELDLVYPGRAAHPKMLLNESGKFESAFLNVEIAPNRSVMLGSLSGSRLGIWVAHGEGRFVLPEPVDAYHAPMVYSYSAYPGNPNGSPGDIAALCSDDGRHLVMMPHLERAFLPWQWAHYPSNRKQDEATPWLEAFVNAREWIKTC
jgi:phosphoribosylformylglycinamidine synthase